jgi:hypothetical protein
MKRILPVGLLALASAAPVLGAEGGAILGGEHPDFSRIVMAVEPTTEWSLEPAAGRAIVTFPGKQIDFSTAGVFDKMPRDRISGITVESRASGSRVVVDLACDCRISTTYVKGQYLALDVSDRTPPSEDDPARTVEGVGGGEAGAGRAGERAPDLAAGANPAETEARDRRDDALLYSAEVSLLRQIEQAAKQGLISLPGNSGPGVAAPGLSDEFPRIADTTPPAAPPVPEGGPAPMLPLATSPDAGASDIDSFFDHEQIEATTVFERYSNRASDRIRKSALPPDCIPDHRLDIDYWSNGLPFAEQVSAIRPQLFGEFDKVNETAVMQLAKVYIRFGFGAEAEMALDDYGVENSDKRLLVDLARVVDGRAPELYGPLTRQIDCPGRHGMWLAAGGAAPAYHSAEHFQTVREAFGDLPPDLRMLLAPPLMTNLLDAGHPAETRMIYNLVARLGEAPSADLELAAARLIAAEGDRLTAMRTMSSLVERRAPNATAALTRLVQLALDGGYSIPDRTVTDLQTAALEYRHTGREPELRGLVAKAYAARGQLADAIDELRDAKSDLEADDYLDAIAVEVLEKSVPSTVGLAQYARLVLSSADLISERPTNDAPREVIAGKLLDLGLAQAAEEMVIPAAGRRAEGRILLAETHLAQAEPQMARLVLDGMGGAAAADVRARAYFMEGDFSAAQAELDRAGMAEKADPIAWPSGDWPRVQETAETPEKASMAVYMARGDGQVPAVPPSDDPASLPPAEAFVEPLPQLQDPSLDAARRLLATGGQVEDFIQSILRGTEDGSISE